MKKTLVIIVLLILAGAAYGAEGTQKPVVAGAFYPAEPLFLAGQIDKYLKEAGPVAVDGDIIALISPHAGYIYSGPVAAYGFNAVSGKRYDTVVILAPSHRLAFKGAAILEKGAYETPLGKVEIDRKFDDLLKREAKSVIVADQKVFDEEHSAEVQIPFIQRSLKDSKISVIVIGYPDYLTCGKLADGIVKAIKKSGKKVLIIASTDFSHYYSYRDAVLRDQATLSELLKYDPKGFAEGISSGECELCGSAPVLTALLASKELGADKMTVLKYANSGDTAGDKSRVVGYASVAIYKHKGEDDMLNSKQKGRLLEIARETIESYVRDGKVPEFREEDPALLKEEGAFVTLHKRGQLRGCIGSIISDQPLYLTVRDMAIESATGDPRFSPVTSSELKDIYIEISVLSQPKKVADVEEIKMGVHGVIVRQGARSGVFLPQVATETGWTRDEFLSQLCAGKAGLSPDAWKDKRTDLYSFTAQVFSEESK